MGTLLIAGTSGPAVQGVQMDQEMSGVAERLVAEFPLVPSSIVMQTVCRCSEECDHANSFFVEHAARAALGRV